MPPSKPLQRLASFTRTFSTTPNYLSKSPEASSQSDQPKKPRPKAMESSIDPLLGLYKPNPLKGLYYGSGIVQKHLLDCLPKDSSKAFIITGNSLATKTSLISQIEKLLGSKHAGTFSKTGEHAPIAQLDQATEQVQSDPSIDTIISVGGGSPIDSAKAISYRTNQKTGSFLTHVCIPTTLSAAETTCLAGFTQSDGVKTGIADPNVYPSYILYDSKFGLETPAKLFMSTGIRALDHAVELQYNATATLMPTQWLGLIAVHQLFENLPKYKSDPKNEDTILRLFLAAYASMGFWGLNMKGGIGLSHACGYALGSPYGIPHGITSCMTLGKVVKLKAKGDKADASKIAGILPVLGGSRSGDDVKDAEEVGDKIIALVKELGFSTTLTEKGVDKSELDIIVKRATGGLSGKEGISEKEQRQVAGVKKMIESLW